MGRSEDDDPLSLLLQLPVPLPPLAMRWLLLLLWPLLPLFFFFSLDSLSLEPKLSDEANLCVNDMDDEEVEADADEAAVEAEEEPVVVLLAALFSKPESLQDEAMEVLQQQVSPPRDEDPDGDEPLRWWLHKLKGAALQPFEDEESHESFPHLQVSEVEDLVKASSVMSQRHRRVSWPAEPNLREKVKLSANNRRKTI